MALFFQIRCKNRLGENSFPIHLDTSAFEVLRNKPRSLELLIKKFQVAVDLSPDLNNRVGVCLNILFETHYIHSLQISPHYITVDRFGLNSTKWCDRRINGSKKRSGVFDFLFHTLQGVAEYLPSLGFLNNITVASVVLEKFRRVVTLRHVAIPHV